MPIDTVPTPLVQLRRSALAAALGTIVVTVAFWATVYAFVSDSAGDRQASLAAGLLGISLVPLVFVVVAFVSGHQSAPIAVVKAMATSLAVGIPVLAVVGDIVTGLVVGVGAGATVAFASPAHARTSLRAAAIVAAGVLILLVALFFPALALVTAPSLPLTAPLIADRFAMRKSATSSDLAAIT